MNKLQVLGLSILIVIGVLLIGTVFATVGSPIDIKISGEGDAKVDSSGVITVTIKSWLLDLKDVNVEINLPEQLKLSSGNLKWKGDLLKDEKIILKIKIVPEKTKEYAIKVIADMDNPPETFTDGVKSEKSIYLISTETSGEFTLSPPEFRYQQDPEYRMLLPLRGER